MDKNVKEILGDLMDTSIEAVEYVKINLSDNNFSETKSMMGGVEEVIQKVLNTLEPTSAEEKSYTNLILYCKNILHSINKLKGETENRELCGTVIKLELLPYLYELRKLFHFCLDILPNEECWHTYRDQREEKLKKYVTDANEYKKNYKYQVSIVLTAYNKLDYTKKTVESIFRYTDFKKLKAELITINNGSSDDTATYFNSLPHTKKVNLKYNIFGTEVSKYLVEGEFVINCPNDVILTKNWLENLLACIKSDQKISWVVPTCNFEGISNNQGIVVNYENSFSDMGKMEEFAASYNHSNPDLWEERSILMPVVAISRHYYNEHLGMWDPLYTQLQFSDDDISTSIRRAGLKQILAKDTFIHHFGSVTSRHGIIHDNSLENMREVYYKKWGVDAWESRAYLWGIEYALEGKSLKPEANILMIEPRFGGSFIQIKTYYKNYGITSLKTVAVVLDERYLDDAKGLFDQVVTGDLAAKTLGDVGGNFDVIAFGKDILEVESKNIIGLLEILYQKLNAGGRIIFAVKNCRNMNFIAELFAYGAPRSYDHKAGEFSACSMVALKNELSNHSYLNQFQSWNAEIENEDSEKTELVIKFMENILHVADENQKNILRRELNTNHWLMAIHKS